ncbi:MAG: UvrD-helicase domain-containing protein [Parachlamydiaceae bacterium]|nr:UvrD-helicase domain-containing protein [Parachlamydiaceae bacterium]
MAKPFNVLEHTQNIHSSYILEASAGTGKTYSIENSVVRLLIDEKLPCTLDALLIVTFTKAATSDLKERIRRNIHKTLLMLRSQKVEESSFPDYLKALCENGEDSIIYAKQKLELALANFEQAPIFTIHGFCHRMLKEYLFEGDLGASLGQNEEGISPQLVYRLIKDFFRLELHEKLISQGQLQRLLSHVLGFEGLERELFSLVTRGIEIASVTPLEDLFQQFCKGMISLKQQIGVTEEDILEDFELQASAYTGICDLQKKPKEENCAKVKRFAALFSKDRWNLTDFDDLVADGLYLVEALNPDNLGKKKQPPEREKLRCPSLVTQINILLCPAVNAARNPDYILCTLACKCKELIKAYLDQKEIFGYDDLLTNMYKAAQQQEFAAKVRRRFTMAIIDEFQDTDPIQWEIFKKIFLPDSGEHGRLYLVGDPKQSIYGFRQADIYTYLAAGKILGPESKATLGINYRSTKPFIEALNALFSPATAPGLITLPRTQSTLPYQPVESGGLVEPKILGDNRGAIHFFPYEEKEGGKSEKLADCEEKYFLPFIGKELRTLNSAGVPFDNCAVLVADRFQAMRLTQYLKTLNIPAIAQHSEGLSETLAFSSLRELLQALLVPQNESSLKIALGGPLLAWSHANILELEDSYKLEPLIAKGIALRKIWRETGFSGCFRALLASSWLPSGKTVAENLLLRESGIDLYQGIHQIAELLIDKESSEKLPPHRLIDAFEEFKLLEQEKDKALKLRCNPEKEGVRILTIHSSKGLEFEIVFALGILRRSRKPSSFIPLAQNQTTPILTVVEKREDPRAIEYAQEIDAEKLRQLYVAFTRAKQRLYIPLLFPKEKKDCEHGTASPIELYLALMGQPEIAFERLYDRIPLLNFETSITFLKELAKLQAITISSKEEMTHLTPEIIPLEIPAINEPTKAAIVRFPRYMHSFTALSMRGHPSAPITQNEFVAPNEFLAHEQTQHTLPAGSLTGTFLHTLLEKIPFHLASGNKQEFVNSVIRFTDKTPFENWTGVLSEMVCNAFSVKLTTEGHSFCLQDIKEPNCYKEHEFTYATQKAFHSEFESKPGYLKGVIDLLFIHEDKYFILDWKSNWLGPDSSFYEQDGMKKAMLEHDYFLQAEIYKGALKLYLKLIDDRPFEEIFGGVIYLFLRGIDPDHKRTSGVFIC